jgi:DNA-binding IclR family transcriptional regulator
LAALIGQSSTGISADDLARALNLPSETLQDILRSLVATGQVVVLKVNGQLTYRTTM